MADENTNKKEEKDLEQLNNRSEGFVNGGGIILTKKLCKRKRV